MNQSENSCAKCSTPLAPGSAFCTNCGTPVSTPTEAPAPTMPSTAESTIPMAPPAPSAVPMGQPAANAQQASFTNTGEPTTSQLEAPTQPAPPVMPAAGQMPPHPPINPTGSNWQQPASPTATVVKKKKPVLIIAIIAILVIAIATVGIVLAAKNAATQKEYEQLFKVITAEKFPEDVLDHSVDLATFSQKHPKKVDDDLQELMGACKTYDKAAEGSAKYSDMLEELEALGDSKNTGIVKCASALAKNVESDEAAYLYTDLLSELGLATTPAGVVALKGDFDSITAKNSSVVDDEVKTLMNACVKYEAAEENENKYFNMMDTVIDLEEETDIPQIATCSDAIFMSVYDIYDEQYGKEENPLIGTWTMTKAETGGVTMSVETLAEHGLNFTMSFTFIDDNRVTVIGHLDGEDLSGSSTYTFSDNKVSILELSHVGAFEYNGTDLRIHQDGVALIFEKV